MATPERDDEDDRRAGERQFGDGPLSRFTAVVYGAMAITACFVVATAPWVAAVLLLPHPVVLAVTGSTIGPAWVATLGATAALVRSRDIEPVRRFARAWREGARQAFVFWTPYFALLLVLAFDLRSAAGPAAIGLAVLGGIALLWGSTVLLLLARFSFRLRDVLRLAAWGLVRSPRWLVADLALLVVLGGAIVVGGELLAVALTVPVAALTAVHSDRLVALVRREFTVEGRAEAAAS